MQTTTFVKVNGHHKPIKFLSTHRLIADISRALMGVAYVMYETHQITLT